MKHVHHSDHQLLAELIRELSEFNRHIRNGGAHVPGSNIGRIIYAFNPSAKHDRDIYHKHIRFIDAIHDVLAECRINIKSKGFYYIKDAICLITDHNSLDVCLNKEIYPHIAEKHRLKSISRIEHSIRNSIDSAYRASRADGERHSSIMNRFSKRPSAKVFLLQATQEVNGRVWNDISL